MTDTDYQLEKFVGFLGDNKNKRNYNSLFPQTKDYDNLKNLLRNGKKDEAKSCIENGCCLNIDRDYSYDGSPLHLAVSLEYSDIVELLLEKGASINSKNDSHETPLMLAAVIGNSQLMNMLLLKASSPYNCSNGEGFSHFHIACMQNNIDIVKKFLVLDIDINKPLSKKSFFWAGFTPLHFAVEFKCTETARFLIENGADITLQDNRGMTPLHLAFRKRDRLLVDVILSEHYYFASNPIDSEGLSHFHIACAVNRRDVVEDFLEKEITIEDSTKNSFWNRAFKFAVNYQCIDVLKYLLQCNVLFVEKHYSYIMNYAYSIRNEEILNLVISSIEKDMVNIQCPPSVPNSPHKGRLIVDKFDHIKRFKMSEYSELHVAVLQKKMDQVHSILYTHHPAIITVKDAKGKTPVHLAFEMKQRELINQLLSLHLEFDGNTVDSNNLSHFHISCTTKNMSVVEDFIKMGVDVNMTINLNSLHWAGCTPLHFAMMYGRSDIVQLLLDNGADYTLKNAAGKSSYDLAIPHNIIFLSDDYDANSSEWEFVEKILSVNEGRKIDNFDDRGITLLHVASANNDIDMIELYASTDIVNKKINKDVTQWAGLTALDLAADEGFEDAVKTLLNCGAIPTIEDYVSRQAARLIRKCMDDKLFLISKNVYDFQGFSTFHLACEDNDKIVVELFLKRGIDVNERVPHNCGAGVHEYEGQTPLHLAVSNGDPDIVRLLLEHGANVNAKDCYFNTPLNFCGNTEVLEILLDYGADPGVLNCELTTALEYTLYSCDEPIFLNAIIENGWDINEKKVPFLCKLNLDSLTVLAEHITRLSALGIGLNEKTRDLYHSVIEKYPMIHSNRFKSTKKCDTELDSMKGIQIDSRTRLYDILFKSSSEMVIYCRNETFRKIVESEEELKQKYPIYAYLVILQFKKGLKRMNLIQEGKKSLSVLTNRWMGDLICETILQFMNDYELTYLNYAASGQNIFQ